MLDELATRITPSHGWDDIVVSEETRAQLRELATLARKRESGAKPARGRGVTALFSGPSGMGKTLAAEILAAHLGLDLYRVALGSVVSKSIGETEKNLSRVFDAAKQSGVVLFFDEADTLLAKRTDVRDSHDRYASIEINFLLQRMEQHSGLAILATNRRKEALDTAFLRRLRYVVEFPSAAPATGSASRGGSSRKKRAARP